jgi:hypothetical protein
VLIKVHLAVLLEKVTNKTIARKREWVWVIDKVLVIMLKMKVGA